MFEQLREVIGPAPAPISTEEYKTRQMNLLSQLEEHDLLLIPSRPESIRSNDVHFPYRNHSDMLYMCGWEDPESLFMAYFENGNWKTALFVQPKDILKEIWEGRRPGVEGAVKDWPVDEAYAIDRISTVIDEKLEKVKRVYLRQGLDSELDAIIQDAVMRRDRPRQQFDLGPVAVEDPSARIAELRLIKSPAEIALMRYSAQISAQAHVMAMRHTSPDVGEWQLESIIECAFKYAGAQGNAYPCIVGSGENATILHYTVNRDPCKEGDVILIDAGSEYQGYAADITRSWPVSGAFTSPQAKIYDIVLEAQEAAIAECKAGNPFNAPHKAARSVLAKGLIEIGVITQTLEEALDPENGELRHWYMHNTGHWLGLDVHDVGVYRPNMEPRLFEPGMVITVEPGLYFGAWRPDVECPMEFANLGIRIEDDVLITEGEPDVLSKDCPKTIQEIEAIVGTA